MSEHLNESHRFLSCKTPRNPTISDEIVGVNYSFQVINRPIDVIESTVKSSFDPFSPFFIGLTGAIFHFSLKKRRTLSAAVSLKISIAFDCNQRHSIHLHWMHLRPVICLFLPNPHDPCVVPHLHMTSGCFAKFFLCDLYAFA
jgi:hypothetical protein